VCPEGKSPQYFLLRVLAGPKSQSGHRGKEKNVLPLPGIETWPSGSDSAWRRRHGSPCVPMFKLSARTTREREYSSVLTRFWETQTPEAPRGLFISIREHLWMFSTRRWAGPFITCLRQLPFCLIYYLRYFRRSLQRKEERQTWKSCLSVRYLLWDA
jgi:hypothetical protein